MFHLNNVRFNIVPQFLPMAEDLHNILMTRFHADFFNCPLFRNNILQRDFSSSMDHFTSEYLVTQIRWEKWLEMNTSCLSASCSLTYSHYIWKKRQQYPINTPISTFSSFQFPDPQKRLTPSPRIHLRFSIFPPDCHSIWRSISHCIGSNEIHAKDSIKISKISLSCSQQRRGYQWQIRISPNVSLRSG